ncbi:hypothetical protein ACFWIN_25655, partial [Streptomyces sp. NPDC127049]
QAGRHPARTDPVVFGVTAVLTLALVLLELRLEGGLVALSVRDGGPDLPVVWDADPTRVGRHGLEIVAAVAHHFEVRREPGGKRVTARVALDGATAHAPVPAHDGRRTGVGR